MDKIIDNVKKAKIEDAALPWRKICHSAVGSARAVGFSKCSRYALVESGDGRGLFDSLSGDKLLHDVANYPDQEVDLLCQGIGPLSGDSVRMAGINGGGLPLRTEDGWRIEALSFWPQTTLLLFSPGSWLHGEKYDKPYRFTKIWSSYELRGFGFSYDGQSLLVCDSSDLTIYTRR